MPYFPRAQAFLPNSLAIQNVAHLNLDEPKIALQSAIHIDPETQGLYLDRDYRFNSRLRTMKTGHVAIMRCLGWNSHIGYVADLRHVSSPEPFTVLDREDIEDDEFPDPEEVPHFEAIAAYVYAGDAPDTVNYGGLRDFFAAAQELTRLVDQMPSGKITHRLKTIRVGLYARAALHHEQLATSAYLLTGV